MSGGIVASAQRFAAAQPDTAARRIIEGLVAHCEGLEGRRQAHRAAAKSAHKEMEAIRKAFVAIGGTFDGFGEPNYPGREDSE